MESKSTILNRSPTLGPNTRKTLTFQLTNESLDQNNNITNYKYTPLSRSDFDMNVVDKWIEVKASNAPRRRCLHLSFLYNNYLYIYGGVDISEGRMTDLHRMNIDKLDDLKWEEVKTTGNGPEALSGQAGVVIQNKFFMFGGENSKQQVSNNLFILDLEELKWEKRIFIESDIPNMMGQTANYYPAENAFIVFGGFTKGKYLNTVYSYSIEKLLWDLIEPKSSEGSALPEGRILHSSVLVDNFIYVYGGVNIEGSYLGDLWKFDLVNKTWEKVSTNNKSEADVPSPRCGHTMTYHPESQAIYIFGGKISNIQERNEMWKFDLKKNSFELIHDTLIEQFNDMNQTDNNFLKNSFTKKKSQFMGRTSIVDQSLRSESQIIANRTSVINSFSMKTQSNVAKKANNHNKNSQHNKKLQNFEDMLLNSPNSKKMKISLIYKMDLADSNTLKQRVSTLLARTSFAKEKFRSGVIPAPRDGHTTILHNGNLVVFGGDRNKFPFNDLFIYNI